MMKKTVKILLFIIVALGLIWVVARVTGALNLFSVPTYSMEPTLPVGTKLLASNLVETKNGDIIIHKSEIVAGQETYYIQRLVAQEGDTFEMRKGECYVNGKNIDSDLSLNYSFLFNLSEMESFKKIYTDWENNASQVSQTEFQVFTTKEIANSIQLGIKPVFSFQRDPNMMNGWSRDQVAPYVVPRGTFLVLGDNRHNSYDSRFFGPLDASNIKGVMVKKW